MRTAISCPTSAPLPPPSSISTVSIADGKWKVRTESKGGMTAQGTIEIPERQSVASLRKQIANKLDVTKKPNIPSPLDQNTNNETSFRSKSITNVAPLDIQNDTITSKWLNNKRISPVHYPQQPVIHGPVLRHLSCITPVQYSRNAVLTSTNDSLQTTKNDDYSLTLPNSRNSINYSTTNFDDKELHSDHSTSRINDGVKKMNDDDTHTITELPMSNNCQICSLNGTTKPSTDIHESLGTLSPYKQQYNNDSDSAIDLTSPAKPSTYTSPIRNDFFEDKIEKVTPSGNDINGNVTKVADLLAVSIPNSNNNNSPNNRPKLSMLSERPEMASYGCPAFMQCAGNNAHSESAKRDSVPNNPDHCLNPLAKSLSGTSTPSLVRTRCKRSSSDNVKSTPYLETPNSQWYRNMFKMMHKTDSSHSSVSEYRTREFTSQTPSDTRISRPWTPNLRSEQCIESLRSNDHHTRRSKSLGRYTDTGQMSNAGHLMNDIAELKKLAKEEVLTRQKVEKLSEELQEQQSRRHGYVPSAAPALQKNFHRFEGLLSEFGTSERFIPPRTCSPSTVATCTALYSFRALNPKELSFNRGDVIRLHRTIDANWMEGERNGQVGIFPSSYVQVNYNPPGEPIKLVALYPFHARNRNELSLKQGEVVCFIRKVDVNWSEGVNNHGQTGIFPNSYVRELNDVSIGNEKTTTPKRPKTPHNTPSPSKKVNSSKVNIKNETQEWNKNGKIVCNQTASRISETCRALYTYKPRNVDELELQENDLVLVVEKCDDGWYIGTSLRTGQFGTFPGNYVAKQ